MESLGNLSSLPQKIEENKIEKKKLINPTIVVGTLLGLLNIEGCTHAPERSNENLFLQYEGVSEDETNKLNGPLESIDNLNEKRAALYEKVSKAGIEILFTNSTLLHLMDVREMQFEVVDDLQYPFSKIDLLDSLIVSFGQSLTIDNFIVSDARRSSSSRYIYQEIERQCPDISNSPWLLDQDIRSTLYPALVNEIKIPRFEVRLLVQKDEKEDKAYIYVGFVDQYQRTFKLDNEPLIINIENTLLSEDVLHTLKTKIFENTAQLSIFGKEERFSSREQNQEEFRINSKGEAFSSEEKDLLQYYIDNNLILVLHLQDVENPIKISFDRLSEVGKLNIKEVESIEIERPDYTVIWRKDFQAELLGQAKEGRETVTKMESLVIGGSNNLPTVEIGSHESSKEVHYRKIGQYDFFQESNGGLDLAYLYQERLDSIKNAVVLVENDFGFREGEVVRRIVSKGHNAQAGGGYTPKVDTLAFFVESLNPPPKDELYSTIIHETLHLINGRFNITLIPNYPENKDSRSSREEFLEVYRDSLAAHDEISNLDESQLHAFDQLSRGAGHAWENHNEFFASLLNSLYMSRPEEALRLQSKEFLIFYNSSLKHISTRLLDISEIPKSAPIFSKINKRIELVNKILRELPNEEVESIPNIKDEL